MDTSLNLNTLANSLPNSNLANAEKDLLNDFKAAALSITTLYRSSRQTSKRAYNTGYISACQDTLSMIQQGVSADSADEEVSVGRIMDWVEARLYAVKAREEEEEEEEEKERDSSTAANGGGRTSGGKTRVVKAEPTVVAGLATPNSPPNRSASHLPHPASPSPASSSRSPTAATANSVIRKFRKESPPIVAPIFTDALSLNNNVHHPEAISTGAKRRHAVMMMLDSSSTAELQPSGPQGAVIPTGRRRTRSTRGPGANHGFSGEAMDIEEDTGRDRKRVTRR